MRKLKTVIIPGDPATNRDAGKIFYIREMSARAAERWALRFLEGAFKSAALSSDVLRGGMAALALVGVKAVLSAPHEIMIPLMDEMFDVCISYQPDKTQPKVLVGAGLPEIPTSRKLIDDDIEELGTILFLREEVINLHTGFSVAAYLQSIREVAEAAVEASNTPTSDLTSGSSSLPA